MNKYCLCTKSAKFSLNRITHEHLTILLTKGDCLILEVQYILHSGLFSRDFFANALWCELSSIKILKMVYKALN